MLKSRNRESKILFFFSQKKSFILLEAINACKNCKKIVIAAQGIPSRRIFIYPFEISFDGINAPFNQRDYK